MVAKLAIWVCTVPGCATIATSSKVLSCPTHPNKSLVREIYEHKRKPGASKPGDLGDASKGFNFGNFDGVDNMGDILSDLFGRPKS